MGDYEEFNWPEEEQATIISEISHTQAVAAYGQMRRSGLLTSNAPQDPTNWQAWLGAGCVLDMVACNCSSGVIPEASWFSCQEL
jgi:hypothetical protein